MEDYIPTIDSISHEDEYQTQRTIDVVHDVEENDIIFAEDFFKQDEAIIIAARRVLELAIQSNKPKLECIFCEQKIKITGRTIIGREKSIYYFAHLKDSEDCPIKTNRRLSLEEIVANKYGVLKESNLHKRLKYFIAEKLEAENAIQKGVKDVKIEKVFKNKDITEDWRRPDVSADYNDKSLVFELLLSATFLSVIIGRESFYRKCKTFIIWIFAGLEERENWQKLMEKDIYYAHKRNAFLLDEEAEKLSNERGELVLNCYWQTPEILNGDVKITWHKKLVTLDELSYDYETYDAYYYNSDKDFYDIVDPEKKAIIDAWEKAKEERWDKIKHSIEKRELSIEQQERYEKRLELKDKELLKKIANKEITPTRFNKDGLWGYKVKNHIVIEPQYAGVKAFKYGVALVKDKNDYQYLIDFFGQVIIKIGETKILDISLFNDIYFKIKIEEEIFKSIGVIYGKYERRIKYQREKVQREKIFDFKGNILYEDIHEFVNNRAKAKKNNKYGYINEEGGVVISFEYDEIQDFIDGRAKAQKNNKYGYINEDGEELIAFEYDGIQDFIRDRAKVRKSNKYGFINRDGIILIPLIFSDKLANSVSIVKEINNIEVYENLRGDFIIPSFEYLTNFKVLSFFRKNSIRVKVIDRADFGIFLEINSEIQRGLLHNSEIWKAGLNLDDYIFKFGNVIDVYIKSVEKHKGKDKISFTLIEPTIPISELYQEFKKIEGYIVEGIIMNIKEFGLFVEIDKGIVGLIHISNLKCNEFEYKDLDKNFKKGDVIDVVIISVQIENKRIELGYVKRQ